MPDNCIPAWWLPIVKERTRQNTMKHAQKLNTGQQDPENLDSGTMQLIEKGEIDADLLYTLMESTASPSKKDLKTKGKGKALPEDDTDSEKTLDANLKPADESDSLKTLEFYEDLILAKLDTFLVVTARNQYIKQSLLAKAGVSARSTGPEHLLGTIATAKPGVLARAKHVSDKTQPRQ